MLTETQAQAILARKREHADARRMDFNSTPRSPVEQRAAEVCAQQAQKTYEACWAAWSNISENLDPQISEREAVVTAMREVAAEVTERLSKLYDRADRASDDPRQRALRLDIEAAEAELRVIDFGPAQISPSIIGMRLPFFAASAIAPLIHGLLEHAMPHKVPP